jgi:hypothetical protein
VTGSTEPFHIICSAKPAARPCQASPSNLFETEFLVAPYLIIKLRSGLGHFQTKSDALVGLLLVRPSYIFCTLRSS